MGFLIAELLLYIETGKKMMKIERDSLVRYFLGQMSEEEKEALHQWLEADEANRKLFIRERIRFDASLLVDEEVVRAGKKRQRMPVWLVRCMEVAASLLVLLGGFYAYDRYQMAHAEKSYQCVSVPAGNRANLLLPDGTNVWLNAGTSLRYPVAFKGKSREVELNGEAYFEVSKSEKPFVVKTDRCDVEVLGTTFDVEAYADETEFRTTLYEGSVQLQAAGASEKVVLHPGETAELVGGNLQVSPTKDKNAYRWKDGLIYIEDQSFEAIMEMFEKFYDVRIVINNPKVKALGYQGKLRIADGIDHALRVLQNDFPFRYKRDEESNTIIIN